MHEKQAQMEAIYTQMWSSHEGGPYAPLDESLHPRPHSMLYEVVSACGVNASSRKSPQRGDSGWSTSELYPLKAEMGDSLVAGNRLRDTLPLRGAKKHTLVRVRNDTF
jgi:hypothetical protein